MNLKLFLHFLPVLATPLTAPMGSKVSRLISEGRHKAARSTAAPPTTALPQPGPDGRYTLSAKGIRAQFIPYAATLTNLFIPDKDGNEVDVVLGYDDADFYPIDPSHPVYNAIPGRYVNRIGDAQYTLDGTTYETEKNDGPNTLHSGSNNWSYRFWEVTEVSETSITFSLFDKEGESQGFPGDIQAKVIYTVADGGVWDVKMESTASARTPLMLTQHTYFNLEAFRNPATENIFEHDLHMPYSKRFLPLDDTSLPTGEIATATDGHIMDFTSPLAIGNARNTTEFATNAGGTEGYNHFWLFEDVPSPDTAVLTLSSPWNGIKADLRTTEVGVQIYTMGWSDGTTELKSTQGREGLGHVARSGGVAIEPQDFTNGINNPEWGRRDEQITGPGDTYTWHASWTFGLLD